MLFMLTITLILLSFSILFFYALYVAVYRWKRTPDMSGITHLPKVAILKPLKHVDDGFEENLESFFTLDYPDYEILFGVDEITDPCIDRLKKVMERHSNVRARVIVTGPDKVMNPKVETLAVMARGVSADLFWVTDSNTRTFKDALRDLVHEYMTNGSKIVFSPILGAGVGTAGSAIEHSYINLFVSGSVITAWKLFRHPIIVGKSMLIERAALEGLGGFERFREYLAEDYMMGDIYRKSGLPLSTNCTWIVNYGTHTTIKGFCSRISRWAKMRYHINTFFYLTEILANPVGIALFSLLWLGAEGLAVLAATVALKVLLEYAVLFLVNNIDRKSPRVILMYPFYVLFKDLLLLGLYFVPMFSKTVNWRGKHIIVRSESRIYIMPD